LKIYKNLITTFVILTLIGCSEENPFGVVSSDEEQEEEISSIVFELDTRLERDSNGYPILNVNPNSLQTVHRISGNVYRDDSPVNIIKFVWGSNLYWIVNRTDGYVKVTDEEYQFICVLDDCVPPTYINQEFLVPTINSSSYSNEDGEVNTMVGVTPMMIDDTLTIIYGFFDNWREEEIYGDFQIILK
tara:strand:- start:816 stop:1379 length:564 start_codon:yes stop_codon:yes gene_type:complete